MKKNRMMRLASVMLVAVLMTTCTISGTFAKYVTSVDSKDEARVAKWGFEPAAMDITGLFNDVYDLYDNTKYKVDSVDGSNVIAPGTTGSAKFAFAYDETNNITAPEVAYTFAISIDDSSCDESIQKNTNIKWKLDDGQWGTWQALLESIKKLSGDESGTKQYDANTLPTGFTTADNEHTVAWKWAFDEEETAFDAGDFDDVDTLMGNADTLADVKLVIKITATQVD